MRYFPLCFLSVFLISSFATPSSDYWGTRKYGIMTVAGKIVTLATYDYISLPGEETEVKFLIATMRNRQLVIGKEGKPLGKLHFDKVNIFYRPLYEVYEGGKVGFMNREGKLVVPCIYDWYYTTDELNGWYILRKDKKYGVVDSRNYLIFSFEFDDINCYDFYHGEPTQSVSLKRDGKYALANRKGYILTDFIYDKLDLYGGGGGVAMRDETYCFLSSTGKEIGMIPANKYRERESIRNMQGLVGIVDSTNMLNLYTYDGQQLPLAYKGKPRHFSEGVGCIEVQSYWYCLIDTLGNPITTSYYQPPVKRELYGIHFTNGLAVVRNDKGLHGVINTKGEPVIPFQQTRLDWSFFQDREYNALDYFVRVNDREQKNIITLQNQPINDEWYDDISCYRGEYIVVTKDRQQGLISFDGKEVIPCKYDRVWEGNGGLVKLEKNGKIGFQSANTGIIIEPVFDDWFYYNQSNYCVVIMGNKQGVVNNNAEMVVPCEYDEIDFTDDDQYIIVTNKEGVSAIMDNHGRIIRPFTNERMAPFCKDLLIFSVSE